MDVNDLRSLVTVVSLVLFIGIVRWAWARSNQAAFAEAANLPFAETRPQSPVEAGRAADGVNAADAGSRP
jgi:cytochrome c oxidase cbb3-type subunit IV